MKSTFKTPHITGFFEFNTFIWPPFFFFPSPGVQMMSIRGYSSYVERSYVHGIIGAVGHTPLVRLNHLSQQTGCDILAKVHK